MCVHVINSLSFVIYLNFVHITVTFTTQLYKQSQYKVNVINLQIDTVIAGTNAHMVHSSHIANMIDMRCNIYVHI